MVNSNVVVPSDYGSLIVNVNDKYITAGILKHGYWSSQLVDLSREILTRKLAANDTLRVYDCGAHIGTYSLAIAKLMPDRIKVRAFEAQRQLFHMLCGNMALNGVRNVTCHYNAVSNTDGEAMELALPDYDSPNNLGGLELIRPWNSDNDDMTKSQTDTVQTVSINSFGEPVDLLKIDVEGMEDRVLAGARETILRHRPVCIVEIVKTDANFVTGFFRENIYRAYRIADDIVTIPGELDLALNGVERLF